MKRITLAVLILSAQYTFGQRITYDSYDIVRLSNTDRGHSYLSTHRVSTNGQASLVSAMDHIDFISYKDGQLVHDKMHFQNNIETTGIIATDMNNDELLDLVLGSYWSNRVSIYLGNPGGGFSPPVHYGLNGHCNGLTIGDINQDDYPDVVAVRNGSGQPIAIHVFLNNGAGALERSFYHDAGDHTNNEIYITDMNNDGKNDILIRSMNGFVVSYLQNQPDDFDFNYIPIMPLLPGTPFTLPGGRAITNDDFDKDGLDDLVISYQDSLIIRKGNGDGTFEPKAFFKYTGPSLTNIRSARLNYDHLDIVGTQVDNLNRDNPDSLFVLNFNPETNTTTRTHAIELPRKLGFGIDQVRLDDFTGDQVPDFAILAEQNDLLILKGDSDDPPNPDDPNAGVIVYPNPTAGRLFIDTRTFMGKDLKLELLDLSSKVIFSKVLKSIEEPLLELDINTPDRILLLRLISEGKSLMKRILIDQAP